LLQHTVLAPVLAVRAVDRPRHGQLARQLIHFGIARIAYEQGILRVEHAETERHVVEGCVELQVETFEFGLLVQQLKRPGFEHGNGARELADFIGPRQVGNLDRAIVTGEPRQRRSHRADALQHPAQHEEAERPDQEAGNASRRQNAHNQEARPGRKLVKTSIRRAEQSLPHPADAALKVVAGGGIAGSGDGPFTPAAQGVREDGACLRRGDLEAARQRVRRRRLERSQKLSQFAGVDLVGRGRGRNRLPGGGEAGGVNEPPQVAEQDFGAANAHERLQSLALQAVCRPDRLGGEFDIRAGKPQQDRQRQRNGEVELQANAGPRQPKTVRHGTISSVLPPAQAVLGCHGSEALQRERMPRPTGAGARAHLTCRKPRQACSSAPGLKARQAHRSAF